MRVLSARGLLAPFVLMRGELMRRNRGFSILVVMIGIIFATALAISAAKIASKRAYSFKVDLTSMLVARLLVGADDYYQAECWASGGTVPVITIANMIQGKYLPDEQWVNPLHQSSPLVVAIDQLGDRSIMVVTTNFKSAVEAKLVVGRFLSMASADREWSASASGTQVRFYLPTIGSGNAWDDAENNVFSDQLCK